ncbi:MAG: radical SAM protein [Firmicutes bacterium]|nr:radical SAM protein [Bacillota bacterium]
MQNSTTYQLSKYLKVIPRPDGFALYHSLFGGLCLVDSPIMELLKAFEGPKSPQQVLAEYPQYTPEYLDSFLKVFIPRQFLTNPPFDEYGVIEQRMEERKKRLETGQLVGVIQLVATNHCNFNCRYCFTNSIYSSKERLELQKSPSNKLMSPETAQKAIEQVIQILLANGRRSLHIQFFGGEPLLNWDLIRFVLERFGHGGSYGIQISYSIVTNGSLITAEIAKLFREYSVPVIVSFDSPRGEDRVMANGKKSFPEIRRGLALLQNHQNRVVFNSVLSGETFDYFGNDLVDFAVDNGVMEIGVLLDLNPGFYEEKTTEAIVEKLWGVYQYAKEKKVVITGYWHMIFQQMVAFDSLNGRGFKTCSATGCQLSIEPSGAVFACKGSSGYFGSIFKPEELFSSEKYRQYAMRAYRNAPECAGCEIENFCSGFCLGSLEKKYQRIDVIEPRTCEVYKGITRKIILDLKTNEVPSFFTPRTIA